MLCDGDAGMAEDLAQSVDVHAIHQAAFSKVVPQTVRCERFTQSSSPQIVFEIRLEVADLNILSAVLCGEHIIAVNVSVLELKPAPHDSLRLLGEIHCAVFSAFCYLRTQKDLPLCKVQILNQQDRAFAQPHACVEHKNYHRQIPVLRKIGFVELGHQLSEIVIRNEVLCVSVRLELPDLFHRIFLQNIIGVEPIKKHSQIADVVVDGVCGNGLSEVSAAVWEIRLLCLFVCVKGVLAALLKIGDVAANHALCHLVNLRDVQLVIAPAFKEPQGVLVALNCLHSEFSAAAINHELVDLIIKA